MPKRYIWRMLLLLAPVLLSAQVASKEPERKAFENSLQKLKVENPSEYETFRRSGTLWAEMLLGRLGYGVGNFDGEMDEATRTALRRYQQNRGIPATGDPMSFDTIERLKADTDLLDNEPLSLPSRVVSFDFWTSGFVTAQGTWTIVGDKMAWPEQSSTIECDRDQGLCHEASAIVSRGDGGGGLQFVEIETYEIERWDDKEIITKPRELGAGCVRYMRRFNRIQKSVTGLRSTVSNKDLCKGITNAELYLVLADGFEVAEKLRVQHQEQVQKLQQISPELLRVLKGESK